MDIDRLKDIFYGIEDTLKKESTLSNSEFKKVFGEFKELDYRKMSDDEIYWNMVCIAFYSGMNANTVSIKLEHIEKYLKDYRKVKDYTKKEIDEIMNDKDTIHNIRKINACVNNAKIFDKIVKKHGSFRNYIDSFHPIDYNSTMILYYELKNIFGYLGEITTYHFLMDLGFYVIKPDRVICREFYRLDLIDDVNDIHGTVKLGIEMADATGLDTRYVDIILVQYGQMGSRDHFGLERGICLEKDPRCSICGVKKYCKYEK